ncbi:MAG: L-seryl-tRNA(Sec) selenium transferase [Sandaracinaceae bacterium]
MSDPELRRLPAVNALLRTAALRPRVEASGRDAVVVAARAVLEEARGRIREGAPAPPTDELATRVAARLDRRPTPFRRVINATGVVLHTNLGRAPLPDAAWAAMAEARGYCDLEMDLGTGRRASRLRGIEGPLLAVTAAEAGMAVNNNAAALLLALAGLAKGRPTAVSRGHLVEIGGGFRLPTIMAQSGSPLLEVGTTNRTHLRDYEEALAQGAGLVLLVHRSNFTMDGYVAEPDPREVTALCRRHDVPSLLDLGSGCLLDAAARGAAPETTVQEALAQGFDAVCFSGDKLLGGPQAGYLVGRRAAIEALRHHPLARALRCDKLTLAAAIATLELYRRAEADREVPVWRMVRRGDTRERAQAWRHALGEGEVVEAEGAIGGGSLPGGPVPGFALALPGADALLCRLRAQDPPVVAHIVKDRVLLHPRTVDPEDDERLVAAVRAARTPR